jgi:hypothetical protein
MTILICAARPAQRLRAPSLDPGAFTYVWWLDWFYYIDDVSSDQNPLVKKDPCHPWGNGTGTFSVRVTGFFFLGPGLGMHVL